MTEPDYWDNLIPLRPSLSGPQLAGWQPGPAAMSGLGCELYADQMIPVDDNVALAADIYRPKTPGRYPVILSMAGYNKDLDTAGAPLGCNEIGSPPVFTDRGYVHIVGTRRGMGRSQGTSGVFLDDQEIDDLVKVIAWAAEQPWCDGNVVTFGTSYYALVQPQVAARKPPALRAFFCNEMCTDYFRHLVQFGGVPASYFAGLWMGANFTKGRFRLHVPPLVRAILSQILNSPLKPYWQWLVRTQMNKILLSFIKSTPARREREWFVNWMVDGKTRALNCIPPGSSHQLKEIEVPYVVVQNLAYFNLHQFGCYDLFENANTPHDRRWMILGPAEYELPVYAWQLEALAFFDHIVRGADNGYATQPAVRYWVEGARKFQSASSFPIPDSAPVRFYLTSGGDDDHATHKLISDAPIEGTNTWAAVPIGVPMPGGFDEVANQLLSYEMKVTETTEFSGPVAAHLKFSCNEIDSHVVARLGRVDRAGGYHLLSMGTISPARRKLDPARNTACEIVIDTQSPQPLTPGEPVLLSFSLTPAPTRLLSGEKLRFDVASRSDVLRSDVSHGYVHFDLPAPPYFSRNTLHYGPETYLEVWKVGTDKELTAAAPSPTM